MVLEDSAAPSRWLHLIAARGGADPGFHRGRLLSLGPSFPRNRACRVVRRSEGPLSGEHHARTCCFLCRLIGGRLFGFAQDHAARRLRPSRLGARPPPSPASRASPARTMGPSATVRASRSSARRLKVRCFRATSPRPRSRIGPAMGRRSSTAIAPSSTSATTASSRSRTRPRPRAKRAPPRKAAAKAAHH